MKFFQKKFRGQTCGRTSDPGKRGGKPPSVNATYLRFGIIGPMRDRQLNDQQDSQRYSSFSFLHFVHTARQHPAGKINPAKRKINRYTIIHPQRLLRTATTKPYTPRHNNATPSKKPASSPAQHSVKHRTISNSIAIAKPLKATWSDSLS